MSDLSVRQSYFLVWFRVRNALISNALRGAVSWTPRTEQNVKGFEGLILILFYQIRAPPQRQISTLKGLASVTLSEKQRAGFSESVSRSGQEPRVTSQDSGSSTKHF